MKLDIGCGAKKQLGHIGIDIGDFSKLYSKDEFIKADVFEFLEGLEADSIEAIYANQFIEHIPKDKFIPFMNQCYRVLKNEGTCEFIFPPAITSNGMPNGSFYADPLHVNAIIPGTFSCFSKEYRNSVKKEQGDVYRGYGIKTDFKVLEARYLDMLQVKIKLVKK